MQTKRTNKVGAGIDYENTCAILKDELQGNERRSTGYFLKRIVNAHDETYSRSTPEKSGPEHGIMDACSRLHSNKQKKTTLKKIIKFLYEFLVDLSTVQRRPMLIRCIKRLYVIITSEKFNFSINWNFLNYDAYAEQFLLWPLYTSFCTVFCSEYNIGALVVVISVALKTCLNATFYLETLMFIFLKSILNTQQQIKIMGLKGALFHIQDESLKI
uniref:Uncharacterized protein n=1 Tax=Glossina brevipalpis TaxID=37001 RepID=A0A1A9WI11_9MUSC